MTPPPNLFPPYIQPHTTSSPTAPAAPLLPSNQSARPPRRAHSHFSLFPKLKHEGNFIVTKHKNSPDAQPAKIARILSSFTKMGSFAKISSDATGDTTLHPPPLGLEQVIYAALRRPGCARGKSLFDVVFNTNAATYRRQVMAPNSRRRVGFDAIRIVQPGRIQACHPMGQQLHSGTCHAIAFQGHAGHPAAHRGSSPFLIDRLRGCGAGAEIDKLLK